MKKPKDQLKAYTSMLRHMYSSFRLCLSYRKVLTWTVFLATFVLNFSGTLMLIFQNIVLGRISEGVTTFVTVMLFAYGLINSLSYFSGTLVLPFQVLLTMRIRFLAERRLYIAINALPYIDLDSPEKRVQVERSSETVEKMASSVTFLAQNMGVIFNIIGMTVILIKNGSVMIPIYLIYSLASILKHAGHSLEKVAVRDQTASLEKKKNHILSMATDKNAAHELRVFFGIHWLKEKYSQLEQAVSTAQKQSESKLLARGTCFNFVLVMLDMLTYVVIFLLYRQGMISLSTSMVLYSTKLIFNSALRMLSVFMTQMFDMSVYTKEYFALTERHGTCDNVAASALDGEGENLLELKDVCFDYGGTHFALSNINLTVRKHEIVALLGKNGSGKSTIANLILGLYTPSCGEIMINGVNYAELSHDNKKGLYKAAFQDFARFELSILENLTFTEESAAYSHNEIVKALKNAGLDEDVSVLPASYHTIVGKSYHPDGIDFSGGQWQKLAFARTLLDSPLMVLYDEPAAALDPIAELNQFEQIRSLMKEKGGLLISHRVGLARLADKILFVDNGKIVEQGTHQQLMGAQGAYSHFYNAQAKWHQ